MENEHKTLWRALIDEIDARCVANHMLTPEFGTLPLVYTCVKKEVMATNNTGKVCIFLLALSVYCLKKKKRTTRKAKWNQDKYCQFIHTMFNESGSQQFELRARAMYLWWQFTFLK